MNNRFDMSNTDKIYHIRVNNNSTDTVYIYNQKNNNMLCASGTTPNGNAHEIKTYRKLFIDAGTGPAEPEPEQ